MRVNLQKNYLRESRSAPHVKFIENKAIITAKKIIQHLKIHFYKY